MDISVIHWKLNEIMARKRIRNKDLAEALGITENSVYRLRRTDQMPRLTPERLNGICTFLECQPGELLEWTLDEYSAQKQTIEEQPTSSSNQTRKIGENVSNQETRSGYKLKVISSYQMCESA